MPVIVTSELNVLSQSVTRFTMSELEESQELTGDYGCMSGSSIHDVFKQSASGSTLSHGTELGELSDSSIEDSEEVQVSESVSSDVGTALPST